MNYYERYVGDFQRDTGHLSCTEIGVYDRLLDHYYALEKPLPADLLSLSRIARAMDRGEREAVERVAAEFFPIGDDGLRHNSRADAEIAKALGRIEAARENGKKGGRPKKSEPEPSAEQEAKPNQDETQQKPNPKPNPNPAETHAGVHQIPCTTLKTKPPSGGITDSTGVDAAEVSPPPPPKGDPIGHRAVAIAVLLIQRGAKLQASDPRVRQWAEEGVTDAQALAALEKAESRRAESGTAQAINAGLLHAILADRKAVAAAVPVAGRAQSLSEQRRMAAMTRLSDVMNDDGTPKIQRLEANDERTIDSAARIVG